MNCHGKPFLPNIFYILYKSDEGKKKMEFKAFLVFFLLI